jgi:isochorismate synthase
MIDRDVVETLCARARDRARESGEPVVVSCVAAANGAEPLAALEAMPPDGFRFAWERPKDGFALTAGGAARRFVAQGARRFHEMSERVGTALRSAITGGPAAAELPAPFVLGGFSFFDQLDETQWPGFGPAQLVIPRWMKLHTRRGAHTVLSAAVGGDDDPAAAAAGLHRLGETLATAAATATVAGRPDPPSAPSRLQRADEVEGHRHWLEMVRHALERIRAGGLTKVVLARAVELAGGLPSPFRMLRALRAAYPDCFAFLMDPGAGHTFLGATPERLARIVEGTIKLGALAGTAPRGGRIDADEAIGRRLLASEKERQEHDIVVQAILDAVRPLGGALDVPDQPRLVKLTNVQHLYTPVSVRPREPVSLISLLARLHPTPAVGGHPRSEALDLIRREERFDRGWYAGPVGWMDAQGGGEFAVGLRSGLLGAGRARLFAGNGIVAGADPESEYFETQLKLQPMLSALADE